MSYSIINSKNDFVYYVDNDKKNNCMRVQVMHDNGFYCIDTNCGSCGGGEYPSFSTAIFRDFNATYQIAQSRKSKKKIQKLHNAMPQFLKDIESLNLMYRQENFDYNSKIQPLIEKHFSNLLN